MLIMAETLEIAKFHAATTVNLLVNLGFTVNYQKSLLTPSTMEFLEFLVDLKTLALSLHTEKTRSAKKAF